jgi:rare lipoprotein A
MLDSQTRLRRGLALALACVLAFAGCSHAPGPQPSPDDSGGATGLASYYADKFEGRRTASGAVYHRDALTAAHRTLPFGTRVRVTRLETGRSVEVEINDRGPQRKDRIIDVSRRAAEKLDLVGDGVARVRIEILDSPPR